MIGAVALIVIGPEKLPKVARMVGTFLGKAQRYVAEVKSEVDRSIALDELKKMRDSVETAAHEVQSAVQTQAADIEEAWEQTAALSNEPTYPKYQRPKKNWRLKQGAIPHWYKARSGIRHKALSGAARVARYRPR